MIDECRRLGMTPLTKDEFSSEEKLMYMDLLKRRRGDYSGIQVPPLNFSVY